MYFHFTVCPSNKNIPLNADHLWPSLKLRNLSIMNEEAMLPELPRNRHIDMEGYWWYLEYPCF